MAKRKFVKRLGAPNVTLGEWINLKKLSITTKTILSSGLSIDIKNQQYRLVEICQALGCDYFYEGKSGQNYIDTELFKAHDIVVEFQDYKHPYYNQLWLKEGDFISHLSIIDLLFNHGPESLAIITGKKVVAHPKNVKIRCANDL